jgi:hypothetical protein
MNQEFLESLVSRVESRVVYYCADSWCFFFARVLLYLVSVFILSSSVLLYKYKNVNATDFGYMLPLSGLSSAALLYVSTYFKPQNKSDLLLDVGVDLLSDFLPSYRSKSTCRKES